MLAITSTSTSNPLTGLSAHRRYRLLAPVQSIARKTMLRVLRQSKMLRLLLRVQKNPSNPQGFCNDSSPSSPIPDSLVDHILTGCRFCVHRLLILCSKSWIARKVSPSLPSSWRGSSSDGRIRSRSILFSTRKFYVPYRRKENGAHCANRRVSCCMEARS